MKRIKHWLGSRTGLAVVASLVVVVALLTLAGSQLGWWSLAAHYLTGTAAGGVNLTSFTAVGEPGRTVLNWKTSSEQNCKGFHIYRAESGTGSFVRVNGSLIPSKPPAGGAYGPFNDMTVESGTTYDYQLRAVRLQGQEVVLKSVTVESP